MQKRLGLACLATLFLAGAASAADPVPVMRWDSFDYAATGHSAEVWAKSPLKGKALMQGVKLDAEGNFYISTARWGGADMPATLSKVKKTEAGNVLVPYPSQAMNDMSNPKGLKAVLGFEIDENDVMWILDQGHVAGKPSAPGAEKLVLWDIKADKEVQRYDFPDDVTDKSCSFLNDVVVDNASGFAYITDSGIFSDPLCGGLIVYDRNANTARRVLGGTHFANDDPNFFFNIGDRKVGQSGPMRTGADGIALSGDRKTLYWTDLTGHTLYSLPTALLRDPKVSEDALEAAVRVEVTLPSNTDGMTADHDGNVYLTALQLDSVLKWDPRSRQLSRVAYSPEMEWPDTLAWGPDGTLYVMANHLNQWTDGVMDFDHPKLPNFTVWRLPVKAQPYLK